MMKNKNFMIWLVLVILLSTLLTPAKAETLCSYEGPGLSEDLLELTNFSVKGPSPLKVGDTITVKFNLRNFGQSNVNLGAKGIFVAARDPDNMDASFGFSYAYTMIEVMQTLSVEVSRILDKSGTWKIWPSYHISLATGEKFGPDEWHACHITVEPVSLPDLIVEKIECGLGNKLLVTIKNNGSGALPSGWIGVADIYFNEVKKGFFDLTVPTTTTAGGIEEPSGISTYLLAWDITEPVTVKVIVDSTNDITESNEQNNVGKGEIEPLEKLPDLIIDKIECDRENSRIGYVIKNVGEGTAKAGHATTLYVNGKEISYDLVNVDLEPGATYESWFKEYKWPECTTIKARVCADDYDKVNESNEQNNCLEKTCECIGDIIPPIIISGPSVSQVTQISAIICWETDEASGSVIRCDKRAGKYGIVTKDSSLVKKHCLTLTKLEPSTTYHFMIESMDSSGNKARSRGFSFETLSLPDDEEPSLSLIIPDKLSGRVLISADTQDNIGVDRVVFFLDGEPVFTDYAPPFEWECDASALDEGPHNFGTQSFDAAGNMAEDTRRGDVQNQFTGDLSPVYVLIITPESRDEVCGWVPMEVEVTHDLGYEICSIECIVIEDGREHIVYHRPYCYQVGPRAGECWAEPPVYETFVWDASEFEVGRHNVRVVAYDQFDNSDSHGIVLDFIEPPPPSIEVTRNVVTGTNGNWFEVWLTIRNTGTQGLSDLLINDACIGFQAIALSSDTTVDYDPDDKGSLIRIDPVMEELAPGETWTFLYHIVPILFSPYNPLSNGEYVIGSRSTLGEPQVLYTCDGSLYQHFIEQPYTPAHEDSDRDGLNDLDAAFKSADYLIVTSEVLLRDTDYAGVDLLLQKAATLAREKRGVLGYWHPSPYSYDSWRYAYTQLKIYITPGTPDPEAGRYEGYWASRLSDAFSHPDAMDAYLLLIGEWEVIPSATYNVHDLNIRWRGGGRTDSVPLSDNFYADTINDDGVPDLIVGRITGNTPQDLINPIQASLDVTSGNGFDRRSAVAAGGYEVGSGDSFEHNTENVASDLDGQGVSCQTLFWGIFIEHAWSIPLANLDYDAFALGDVDNDGIDEVIIAKDEEHKIYIYEPEDRSFIGWFRCEFTRYDGFAAGDLDDDGIDEIIIARDDDDTIYIYEPDGTLVGTTEREFNNWDVIATGDVLGDDRDEVLLVSDEHGGSCSIYSLVDRRHPHGDAPPGSLWREGFLWHIDEPEFHFSSYDGFAVGNVIGDASSEDEIVIIRDDDSEIYIYDTNGFIDSFDARFTHCDGFAIGDVDDDTMDEMVVIIDEDDKIYIYQDNGRYYDDDDDEWKWKKTKMYSRHFDNWFHGIRYTASDTRYDGFAIGRVTPGDNPKIAILRIRDADSGSFEVLSSTWEDADEWANERLGYADDISILTVSGHGNPGGASPIGCGHTDRWNDFSQHPFVMAMSCLTGNYGGVSFSECLFAHGAAVFIGSTEVSAGSSNDETIRRYFDNDYDYHWDIWSERAGKAFTEYERQRATQGNWWRFWVYEYNYYGDPKFPFGG